MFNSYDAIILTKTCFFSENLDSELELESSKIFREDRNPDNSSNSNGDGVLMSINSVIDATFICSNIYTVSIYFFFLLNRSK